MTSLNFSALATLTNNPPRDYINFLLLLNRPIIAVCDNDIPGQKLKKFGHYSETPETDKGKKTQLNRFYKRHGFTKNKDQSISDTMIKHPG